MDVRIPEKPMASTYGKFCVLADDATIGESTRIGNFVLIRDGTVVGKACTIGSYVDIEGDVQIGDFVSLQSGCYITRGVIIEDLVFCGPRIVTINDKRVSYRRPSIGFHRQAPRILRAARVGGGVVLCPGTTVGENALVGAGSVVTRSIPDRAIAAGNPARVIGKVPDDEII
jgi:UDP-2-acetamido-3-amino-2,3-dideoxy-glucuronate N-acetyltransferase